MATVGSAQVDVRLSLKQLLQDAQRAAETIKQQLKDQQVKVSLKTEAGGIAGLARTLKSTYGEAQQFAKSLGLTGDQANAAIARIRELNAVGATTAEKYKALKNEFGLTAIQMSQLSNAAKNVEGQLNAQAKAAQNNSQQVVNLARSLNTSYAGAERFAAGLGLTAQKANEAIAKLRDLDKAGATNAEKFRVLSKELSVTSQQFEVLNKSAKQTTEGLTAVATGAGAVGAAVSAAFVKGTRDFIAFDSAVRQSGVISGSTGTPQLQALREEVERLGIVTSKAPAEVARMSVSLSRAGFTAEESAASLEAIVRASEGTGEATEVVGDIVAKTYRAFQKEFDAAAVSTTAASQTIADALVATANNTNTTVSSLGESLKYVSAVGAAANQPMEDLLILIGLLGDSGIQGSQAGTNLAAALERLKTASAGAESEFSGLLKGSAKATAAFEAIGAEVRNADGSMKSVLEILPLMQQNLNGLSQADRDILMKALFGVEGGRAFQVLLNTTPDRIDLVTKKIYEAEGAAIASGQALNQGLGGALNLFGGSLETVSTKFGEFIAVGLEPAVTAATNFLNTFLGAPPIVQKLVIGVTALTGAFASAVAIVTTYKLLNIQLVATQAAQTAAMIASALATKGAAAAQLLFNTQITATNLQLVASKAGLLAGAIAQQAYAVATGGATVATKGLLVALAGVAPLLVVIAAGIAAIKFAQYANDLRQANEAIDEFSRQVETSGNEAIAAASRTKAAVDRLTAARNEGRKATDQEIADAKRLVEANNQRLASLQEELKVAQQLPAANDEQKRSRDALLANLQTSIGALQSQNQKLDQYVQSSAAATKATDEQADSQGRAADAIAQAEQRIGELDAANELRQVEIREAIASQKITEAQGQQQLLEQERTYQQQRLKLVQDQAQQLRDAIAGTTDPEKLDELNKKLVDADKSVLDARLAIADSLNKEREEKEKAALERIEAANKESEARITQSQRARVLAVRQAQLSGVKTAEQAEQEIAQIEQQGITQRVAQKRKEIAQVQQLRQQGTLSAEEARDRELTLNEEIGQLNLQRIETEIAAQERARQAALKAAEDAKRAAIEAIEATAAAAKAPLEAGQIQLDIAGGSLGLESNLLSAQAEQQAALAEVEQARLSSAIERARLSGDEVQANQLKLQQVQAQQAALEQQFSVEQQQLKLSQQQRAIELERQRIAAEIAAIEAEVAVQKAIANGATEQEIGNLQTILRLRQQQVQQAKQAESQQGQLNQLESGALQARQEARRIQGQTAIAQQQQAINDARKSKQEESSRRAEREGDRPSRPRGPSAEELERQRIEQGLRTGFNAAGSVQQLKSKVPSTQLRELRPVADLGGLGSVVQEGNGLVVTELRELKASIMQLANTPRCVSVSAPDPVGAVGQVLSDIGRQNFRRSKL
jgi:TP901 family phage tail tape measure protein